MCVCVCILYLSFSFSKGGPLVISACFIVMLIILRFIVFK